MKTKILGCLFLLLLPALLRADDIVLIDGRYLQVKVLGATEKKLHIKLLVTGGELWIPWDLIRESDRDRLMVQFGYKEDERPEITRAGVRLVTKAGEEFFGVPEKTFDAQSVPDEVVIIYKGRKWPFKKNMIRTIEWQNIPALEAYTKEQLYEQRLASLSPGDEDLEGHWDLARYCMDIELYARAVEHMLKVREIDPGYRSDFVANQLERLEMLARNQKIVDAIRGAKRESYHKRFDRSVEELDQILSLASLDPNLKADAELTKEGVLKRRWDYFAKLVTRGYFDMMNNKIGKMSRDRKLKLKEAQNELRRELHKEIVADLATKHGLDAKKEVEKMWEERVVHQPRRASYGSGTFIILGKAKGAEQRMQQMQRQMQRQARQQRNQGGRRGGNQQQQQQNQTFQPPKPPTKDDWWDKLAVSNMRAQWMKCYYAENGKKLEVVGERKNPCSRCGGTGSIKFAGAQGETIPVTCPRCQGHRHDKGVAYK
ncbi:MAG: hypothetical protein HRU14_13385 [Planctomycetes bacterium]|nr:hypothetical protein [Planctomycetota bacterium]